MVYSANYKLIDRERRMGLLGWSALVFSTDWLLIRRVLDHYSCEWLAASSTHLCRVSEKIGIILQQHLSFDCIMSLFYRIYFLYATSKWSIQISISNASKRCITCDESSNVRDCFPNSKHFLNLFMRPMKVHKLTCLILGHQIAKYFIKKGFICASEFPKCLGISFYWYDSTK